MSSGTAIIQVLNVQFRKDLSAKIHFICCRTKAQLQNLLIYAHLFTLIEKMSAMILCTGVQISTLLFRFLFIGKYESLLYKVGVVGIFMMFWQQ